MKKTDYISSVAVIAVILAFAGFSGCKKYLDQQPITSVSLPVVFSDVNRATQAVYAAYSRIAGLNGYGNRLSSYFTLDNDEMQGTTGSSDNSYKDINRFAATPGNTQFTAPFNRLFQGIEYANICIQNIPEMDLYKNGSEIEKKKLQRLYGEALTIRAQSYFEAIRNWGDLPAHFEPAYILSTKTTTPPQVSRDTLYNKLLDDLKLAATLLPWRNEVASLGEPLDQRITKGTTKAVRARIALFAGGYSLRANATMQRVSNYQAYYQIAREECNEIINSGQHNLNPSYKALWKNQVNGRTQADPDGELMFQVAAFGRADDTDSRLGFFNGNRWDGTGQSSIFVLPTYFYAFNAADQRRLVTCVLYNITNGFKTGNVISSIYEGKYRREWVANPVIPTEYRGFTFGLAWQIMRYSDVLLMYAEAENELNGPTSSAYDAINKVRRRGYGRPIAATNPEIDLPTGLSKAAFFDYLVKERSLELGGEGVRKFDLIRWNLLAKKINETRIELQAMANRTGAYANLPQSMYFKNSSKAEDETLWANSFYEPAPATAPPGTTRVIWVGSTVATVNLARFATGFTANKSELFPFATPALAGNPNIKQNPGY